MEKKLWSLEDVTWVARVKALGDQIDFPFFISEHSGRKYEEGRRKKTYPVRIN